MTESAAPAPVVKAFYDRDTGTFSYVVHDPSTSAAAIIDPVLDYDMAAARTSTRSADAIIGYVREHGLRVAWILETHAHADHLSAGDYLREQLGGTLAIGRGIVGIQQRFVKLFGLDGELAPDGRQFDRLFDDDDRFAVGSVPARVVATPGHTDDSLTYVIGDAAFIGDTMFAPDTGTARCDFPGGDARRLYASIQRILSLPPETRLFLCHDYPGTGREPTPETSIAAQRISNVHIGARRSREDFVELREKRDATLPVPRLILPSLQVNIRGGRLPDPGADGVVYLKLPLNQIGRPQ